MPRVKIACLILATVLASIGTFLFLSNLGGGEVPPIDAPTDDVNSYLDRPESGTPADVADVRENLFIAHKVLLQKPGFYGVSEGTTGSLGFTQSVRNVRYVVGEYQHKNTFKQMVTKGVIPNAYQMFLWGDNYLYRGFSKVNSLDNVTWKDTVNKLSQDDFLASFGHRADKITGYILNYQTVQEDSKLEKVENGLYTFRFKLDPISATAYMRKEMLTSGGLDDYPVFSKAELVVTMDADWNVKTLTTDCGYTAKTMGMNPPCTENITETFYDYDGDLPEKDFYEQFFDADFSDVTQEKGALDVLMDMFSPYLNGEDLQVELAVKNGNAELVNGLVSISGLDISDLSKLSVNAKLANALDVSYEHGAGKIYLKYQDFQASTTVDGVMGLVATLAPLFGDGIDLNGALGDLDVDALLANLTFEISDDGSTCTVSLPLSLAGIDVDAKLYADVDGEKYTFTNAVIKLGNVEITLAPKAWSVEQKVGAYPEILGLAELIQNGKISLNADLALALGGVNYDVAADALIDLSTLNVALNAKLGDNGSVSAVLADKVVYARYGEVKVKLDLTNLDGLMQAIEKLAGTSISMELPQISVADVLGMLLGITATSNGSGVVMNLSVGEICCNVYLVSRDNGWNLDRITVEAYGISATVAPSTEFGEVTVPSDADDYADVTELIETFSAPILQIINGNSYGVSFALTLAVGDKSYYVEGSVALDVNKTVRATATVYDGNARIVEAEVIYANGTVYLTLNGLKAAFAVSGGSADFGIDDLVKLLDNEQIVELLNTYEELGALVDKIVEIVGVATNFELSDLLGVDFTEVITAFDFTNGKLSLTVDGSALGFDGIEIDLALCTNGSDLTVEVGGLQLASIGLALCATMTTDVEIVDVPVASDYVLNLSGSVTIGDVTVDVEVSADLISLDVWAVVHVCNETVYLRYRGGTVYVSYGNVAIKLDTANLDDVVATVTGLLGIDVSSMGELDLDVNAILSAVSIDLTDASLVATVTFEGISLTLAPVEQQAAKLDVTGYFVDGNALIGSILETVEAYKDANSVAVELTVNVAVDSNVYTATINLYYNQGLHAIVKIADKDGALVNADVYFVDGVLYLDVNGVRQAMEINLPQSGGLDGAALMQLMGQVKALIAEFDNATLNAIVETIEGIPEKLVGANYSQFISLFRFENGVLTLGVDLSQLDLGSISATVGLGKTLTLAIDQMSVGSANVTAAACVQNSCDKVEAPALDTYYNEFKVTIGDFIIYLKLDLYHMTVVGETTLLGGTVAFKYVDGSIYATYGNVGVTLKLKEIDALTAMISQFVTLPELSLGEIDVVETVKTLLDNLQFTKDTHNDSYAISASIFGVDVTIDFSRANGVAALVGVTVAVDGTNVQVESVSNYNFVGVDTNGYFVSIYQLANTFIDNVEALVKAKNYAFDVNGKLTLGDNTYLIEASVILSGADVYATFKLSVGNATMLDGKLWVLGNVLYLSVGDLKLAVELPTSEHEELTAERLKETLDNLVGYNGYLDQVAELVCNLLDTQLQDVDFVELITKLMLDGSNLTLGINGSQFGLSQIELVLSEARNGLQIALSNLVYKDVKIVELSGSISAFNGKIPTPSGDFSTNLQIIIDENNTLYANIDLQHNVIKLQLESRYGDNESITLDIEYSMTDKILKLTNGKNLYVSADIINIAEIVQEIEDIVNEFAGTQSGALSGLSGLGSIDLKAIIQTLKISTNGSNANVSLTALGFNVTATFSGGALVSVVVPVMDGLTLTAAPSATQANYATFPTNVKYVRIDEVFNDYFYGVDDTERGAIDALIHTNSWKFDFAANSTITINNDDGTTDVYQIAQGSYLAFYYNQADVDGLSLRAQLTINKLVADKWKEFIILDLAYIDGRIYVTYDSNSGNDNVLRATVSIDAIKECIDLLPKLYKVVPQIEELVNNLTAMLSEASGGLTLGSLASMFDKVTYDNKVFTLSLNEGIVSGLGAIYLSVQQHGEGLQLNSLTVKYNNVSIALNSIVVTASPVVENDDGSRSFDYVDEYILSYLSTNGDVDAHMNLDSIRELLAAFVITADNVDDNGNRSFAISGNIHANIYSLAEVDIQIYLHIDIDKDNNVYLAVKLHRNSAEGLFGGLAYKDEGGDSYVLLNGKQQTITLARNSINKQTWCKKCGWNCTNSVAHALAWYHSKKEVSDYEYSGNMSYLVTNLALEEFSKDTSTLVNYILKLVNFTNIIESTITKEIGKEKSGGEYGVEDILTSYVYSYDPKASQGTFAIGANLKPIDSALGDVTVNILHVGNFDEVYYDENGNFHDGGVALSQINGGVNIIKVMDATFTLNLVAPTSGLATHYVTTGHCLW